MQCHATYVYGTTSTTTTSLLFWYSQQHHFVILSWEIMVFHSRIICRELLYYIQKWVKIVESQESRRMETCIFHYIYYIFSLSFFPVTKANVLLLVFLTPGECKKSTSIPTSSTTSFIIITLCICCLYTYICSVLLEWVTCQEMSASKWEKVYNYNILWRWWTKVWYGMAQNEFRVAVYAEFECNIIHFWGMAKKFPQW